MSYKLSEILAKKIGFGNQDYDYSKSIGMTLDTFTNRQLIPLSKKLELFGTSFEEPFTDLVTLVDKFGKLVLKGSDNRIFNLDSLENEVAEYVIVKLENMNNEVDVLNKTIIDVDSDDMSEDLFKEIIKPMSNAMQTLEDSMMLIAKSAKPPSENPSIGFNIKEEYGMRYELEKYEEQIKLEHGPQKFRDLQLLIQEDREDEVAEWLEENGFAEQEITEFYEGFVRYQINKSLKETQNIFQGGKPFGRRSDQDYFDKHGGIDENETKLPESISVGNYTFRYNSEDKFYECRGSVSYDDYGDEQPEKALWEAAVKLANHLKEKGYDGAEASYSEKGWVEVYLD